MPSIDRPISECPECGSTLWDNRGKKKTAKSPDFKCRNKQCDAAFWLKGEDTSRARANGNAHAKPEPKWTWGQLSTLYGRSLLVAEKHVTASATRTDRQYTVENILSAAATIFIAASRDGVRVWAKPKPAPLPEPAAEGEEDETYTDPNDDLPF